MNIDLVVIIGMIYAMKLAQANRTFSDIVSPNLGHEAFMENVQGAIISVAK